VSAMTHVTGVLLAVAGGALLGAAGLVPLASAQTTIGTFEGSIPIETLQGSGGAINRIVVESHEAGSVVIAFDDVVLSEQGIWEAVELGTTPYTLESRIRPDPAVVRYEGVMVGQQQTFDVALRTSGLGEAPRAGLITYTFVPDVVVGAEGSVGIRRGVAVRVRTTNVGDALVRSGRTLTLTRLPWLAALPFVDAEGWCSAARTPAAAP
jgi:hypothetical protein